MKLPLCRFRQIVELISQRVEMRLRAQAKMIEWQTKQLAAVIASTSALTDKGRRDMERSIRDMKLMPEDELVQPLSDEDEIEEIIEHGSPTAADDPRNDAAMAWLERALA